MAEQTIRVGWGTDIPEGDLPADTPVYAETWDDVHSPREDDGSTRAIEDLMPAGTLGQPMALCGGRCLGREDYMVEDGDSGFAGPVEIIRVPAGHPLADMSEPEEIDCTDGEPVAL